MLKLRTKMLKYLKRRKLLTILTQKKLLTSMLIRSSLKRTHFSTHSLSASMLSKARSFPNKIKSKSLSKTQGSLSKIDRTRSRRTQDSGLTMLPGPVSSSALDWSLPTRTSLICSALLQKTKTQTPGQRLSNKRKHLWAILTF